jgi:hypothetical protein
LINANKEQVVASWMLPATFDFEAFTKYVHNPYQHHLKRGEHKEINNV